MDEPLTPHQRVFGTLKNMLRIATEAPDLNAERERLKLGLDRAISWESELVDKSTNNNSEPADGKRQVGRVETA
ncbi:MAG: hypothetical protein HY661_19280 [Betaproteobacteria bacterium]|nr:hypothetical protein [Betaproteobacteria bacterium]